jgi:hypothetical protein
VAIPLALGAVEVAIAPAVDGWIRLAAEIGAGR